MVVEKMMKKGLEDKLNFCGRRQRNRWGFDRGK